MRDYGRVASAFWQDDKVRALPEDGRTLLLYLLTCPHANLIGCFRLPDAYVADDVQWGLERVRAAFVSLVDANMIERDSAQWLVIPNYIKWNRFENANVAKAAMKAFDQVPSGRVQLRCAEALQAFGVFLPEGFANRLETLLKPSRNPEPEPIQNQNLSGTRTGARTRVAPTPAGSDAPPKSRSTWEAYAEAYRGRYGVDPVRNQRANALLCQLVDRLGTEEAPPVAAFFVRHQKSVYVSGRHPIELLVRDAEALRTDWATGRQSTVAAAVLGDRTQQNANVFGRLIEEAESAQP